MKRTRTLIAMFLVAVSMLSGSLLGEDVAGEIENPNRRYGKDIDYRLVGKTTFGWKLGQLTGDLDLNGHDFTMETGGGNRTVFSGAISGTGSFRWNGGGNAQWQTVPSFLTGKEPNSFTGTLTVLRGTLALAKPAGISAFAGNRLLLGGGGNQAIIRLDASEQLSDTCQVQIVGKHEGRIWTQGNSETMGTLVLKSFGYIDLGDGESRLRFADSSKIQWDLSKTLTIQNWSDTHEDDEVSFGASANGLTAQQLARIGFENPSNRKDGLYSAQILVDGRIIPDQRVEAVDAPFDVSDKAKAVRRKIYSVPGREMLSGKDTSLVDGTRIAFFGDSITWQNNYIREIGKAIKSGEGTKELNISLFNHGINPSFSMSRERRLDPAAALGSPLMSGCQA